MSRRPTLPLGIDIGAARTRVALLERDASGAPRLLAVASRPTGADAAAAILDAAAELGTNERRCVLALSAPNALLRAAVFPRLRRRERERAARFEAARTATFSLAGAAVRVMPLDATHCVLGVAPRVALDERLGAARRARLRPVAVDDAAFALRRAFPVDDAIVDIGDDRTVLVIPDAPIPTIRTFAIGGRTITSAIADALGIDEATAEARKRSVGLAGAGEHARDALIEQLAAALLETRAVARLEIRSIALAGNGARLAGFAEALERAAAIPVHLAALPPGVSSTLPADVVRAASPDWGLAYGLALWADAT